jgi:uncharacterized circularly permuted ATP-grasp superfamily protein
MAALAFDEMITAGESPREPYQKYSEWFTSQDRAHLITKSRDAENIFRKTGITFAVYGHEDSSEKLIPFDIIPRIISGREWRKLAQGIEQRVIALNAFLDDIYHKQEIIRAGRVPRELIEKNIAFIPEMIGFRPPGGVYTHIVGTDIVRTGEDQFYVLEDNARTPSGVSYMLENRETMMQMFPELFHQNKVRPVEDYPNLLRQSLASLAPPGCTGKPRVAVLTPGIFNSAYYEHSFLADMMGVELVEGSDLRVIDGKVKMRTTRGYEAIDVLYRRVDDDFLDPLTFRPDSALGIPGIMDVYRAGHITIANAPGTGISDDKAIYSYMPEIVEFYTGRKPLLENVPTWRCSEADSLKYVLEHLVRTRRQGSPRLRRLRHAGGPDGIKEGMRRFRREAESPAEQLYRPADPVSVDRADHGQQGHRSAPRRSAALCARVGQGADHPRRVDARGTEGRLAGGQFQPGRRHQGHLGTGGLIGTCLEEPQMASTGCSVTSSAPKT